MRVYKGWFLFEVGNTKHGFIGRSFQLWKYEPNFVDIFLKGRRKIEGVSRHIYILYSETPDNSTIKKIIDENEELAFQEVAISYDADVQALIVD